MLNAISTKLGLQLIMYSQIWYSLSYSHLLVNSGIRNEFLVKRYPSHVSYMYVIPFQASGWVQVSRWVWESRWVWVSRWVWAKVAGYGHLPPSVRVENRVGRTVNGKDMGGIVSLWTSCTRSLWMTAILYTLPPPNTDPAQQKSTVSYLLLDIYGSMIF